MAYMHEFPGSKQFDSDLREIVEMYLKLKDLPDKWDAFEELISGEVEELKNFVNNYFNNLDVQNEINNKLDAMAKDGSLTNIIKPIFDEFQRTVDVLSARMDTFTSLPDDATSGDAELADAHVGYKGDLYVNVGEHIRSVSRQLSSEITDVKNILFIYTDKVFEWSQGGKNSTTGKNIGNTSDLYNKQVKTPIEMLSEKDTILSIYLPDGYLLRMFEYSSSSSDDFIGCTRFENKGEYLIPIKTDNYYCFDFGYTGTSVAITPVDVPDELRFYTVTNNMQKDDTLYVHCSGDSLTNGTGSSVATATPSYRGYPYFLQQLIGEDKIVVNDGVGQDKIEEIACRQGGIEMFVEPFAIPSDTTQQEIKLYAIDGTDTTTFAIGQNTKWNPVTIAGVKGTISFDSESNKHYFTRSESGSAVNITRPVKVYSSNIDKKGVLIMFMGSNNRPDANTIREYFDYFDSMVRWNGNDKYIVIGLTSKAYMAEVEEINNALAKRFGHHFLDVRKYLIEYGISDSGLNQTEQDSADIANGEIPTSLRAENDVIHLNDYGYQIIANLVYKKGLELGYWL